MRHPHDGESSRGADGGRVDNLGMRRPLDGASSGGADWGSVDGGRVDPSSSGVHHTFTHHLYHHYGNSADRKGEWKYDLLLSIFHLFYIYSSTFFITTSILLTERVGFIWLVDEHF